MAISVVIPVRNDGQALAGLLGELQSLRGAAFEVIVVEACAPHADHSCGLPQSGETAPGQSCPSAEELAGQADQWLRTEPGRALQLQRGAEAATHPCLWFLHADTRDVMRAARWLIDRCERAEADETPESGGGWGRFDVQLDDQRPILRVVSWFMNWRSRLTSICTGDQGIFVDKPLLEAVGGWPQQLLMEDVELSKRLRARARPVLPARGGCSILTSARRWRTQGAWRTILLMWWLRLRYSMGGDPARLYQLYYGARP